MRFTIEFEDFPEEARRWFAALPEAIGTERFFRANELLNGYVDRLVHGHVAALRAEPVARPVQWQWMLRKLERARFAELDPWGRLATLSTPPESPAEVKAAALAEIPEIAPSFALFDAATAGYPEFLRGARDGASILLAPSSLPVWQRYFDNADLVYAGNNGVAGHLMRQFVERREGGVELLEIGGGLGSAAEAVLTRAGGGIARYRFTEPFPWFLAGAKRRLARVAPEAAIDYAPLDMNEPFAPQGIGAASVDAVLAVNVLHVARHLGRTLAEIRRALKPGGALVLVECVRPSMSTPIYVDYPFQLLDEFLRAEDLGPARPHGGFLSVRHWRGLLAGAGLRLEHEFPDHSIAAPWYENLLLAGFTARA